MQLCVSSKVSLASCTPVMENPVICLPGFPPRKNPRQLAKIPEDLLDDPNSQPENNWLSRFDSEVRKIVNHYFGSLTTEHARQDSKSRKVSIVMRPTFTVPPTSGCSTRFPGIYHKFTRISGALLDTKQ